MTFDDDMIAAGHRKVSKDSKYFVEVDEAGDVIAGMDDDGEPEEVPSVDCNGAPISPHVWIPAGVKKKFYKDNDKEKIKKKIKDKDKPDIEVKAEV